MEIEQQQAGEAETDLAAIETACALPDAADTLHVRIPGPGGWVRGSAYLDAIPAGDLPGIEALLQARYGREHERLLVVARSKAGHQRAIAAIALAAPPPPPPSAPAAPAAPAGPWAQYAPPPWAYAPPPPASPHGIEREALAALLADARQAKTAYSEGYSEGYRAGLAQGRLESEVKAPGPAGPDWATILREGARILRDLPAAPPSAPPAPSAPPPPPPPSPAPVDPSPDELAELLAWCVQTDPTPAAFVERVRTTTWAGMTKTEWTQLRELAATQPQIAEWMDSRPGWAQEVEDALA